MKREAQLQEACITIFRYQFPKLSKMLIHVPNGGSRNIVEAANMKKQGVVAGVSDLLLLVPRGGYGCLCIEMKTKDGKQSDYQKQWQIESENANNKYVVCRTVEHFIDEVKNYLNL